MPNVEELIKQEFGEMRTFVDDRVNPLTGRIDTLTEENLRLEAVVKELQEGQKRRDRAALLREFTNTEAHIVASGKYRGFTPLDMAIVRKMLAESEKNQQEYDSDGRKMLVAWRENFDSAARALDDTTSGAGDELVPTLEASELWRDVHLMTAVASLFPTIPMPSNPFDIPLDLGDVNWYPGTANTAGTSTDPATAKRTLTAYELVASVPWSYNLDEDAVIAMMPELRALLVRNAAEVLDDVVLNADTTLTNNINADGATIAASDTDGVAQWLIGFDGLRHIPLVDNTGQGNDHSAALTLTSMADFTEIRGYLGKYGVRPSELAYIVDIPLYIQAMAISDILTLDKYGPQATVLTGELGKIGGVPLIVSEVMRETDDDGKVTDPVTAAGNDNSGILVVNRTQYYKGFRRELLLETFRDIQKRQTIMVASMRVGFDGRTANASDTAVALQYNIT